jgi:hypothetical protein
LVTRDWATLKSFLPKSFRPNRVEQRSAPVVEIFQASGAFLTLFQDATRSNLAALLKADAPVAMAEGVFNAAFGQTGESDPLAGYGLADWQAGKLPDSAFASRLMVEPMRAAAIATPQSGIGADILLPQLLRIALGEGAFRHELAEACRRFLCDRVLFHPGPPPQPLFSVAGLALLFTSQPAQTQALSRQAQRRLHAAVGSLYGPAEPLTHWDQWLLRRMAHTAGWVVPEGLATLRWVAWQSGDPMPELTAPQTVPPSWPNLLTLDP